jgi:hypothetical protein
MLQRIRRVVFSRWLLILVGFSAVGACTTGCFYGRGGGWHHHDRW